MKKIGCRFIFLLFLGAATSEKIHQTISEVFDRSDVFKPNKSDLGGNWKVVPMEKKNDPLTTSLPEYVEVEEYGKDVGMVWMENTAIIFNSSRINVSKISMFQRATCLFPLLFTTI